MFSLFIVCCTTCLWFLGGLVELLVLSSVWCVGELVWRCKDWAISILCVVTRCCFAARFSVFFFYELQDRLFYRFAQKMHVFKIMGIVCGRKIVIFVIFGIE